MCGIFGVVVGAGAALDAGALTGLVELLFKRSEARGKEAAGLAVLMPNGIEVFKCPRPATEMLRYDRYRRFYDGILGSLYQAGRPAAAFAMIGHSRLVTNGTEILSHNNQPVLTRTMAGIHNGIICNDNELWRAHPDLQRTGQLDTEVALRLIEKYSAETGSDITALRKVFGEIRGTASVAYLNDAGLLGLATNTGSLYIAENRQAQILIFASERFTIENAIALEALKIQPGRFEVRHVAAGSGVVASIETAVPQAFSLTDDATVAPPRIRERRAEFAIVDRATARPATMRRCTRCILPETFPMITFDEKGVCSVCRSHEAKQLEGRAALERQIERYRSKDGSPDCIIAFSGGRDSAYGLHYLKRELGMNPIAFTYDWGMVTDNGRRNQALMCGQLGVEHIIRSPDIRAKRRYIRQNLMAWLQRPDLGMVPLLSAGDKQFYHYGRKLRQETGVRLTVFCAGNELERTEFKTGFAGVRETQHGMRLNAYSLTNKLGFLLYYVGQYLKNPRYINLSLLDTLASYWSTYIAKDDFLYLYHYIPWEEDVIMKTLVGEYGWEGAADTNTTWRLDDAFTPFHNYIYYTVAGFSEHDTFRSNQIRAGLIERSEALRLVEEENQPRLTALREYAELVGINLVETLLVIDAIPKLYER